MTFGELCNKYNATDEEYEKLLTYWLTMRLQASGILGILMMRPRR